MQERPAWACKAQNIFYLALYRESLPAQFNRITDSNNQAYRRTVNTHSKMREPKWDKTLEYNSFNAPGIQTFIELPCFESHFLGTDSVSRSRDSFLHGTHQCWDPHSTLSSGRVPMTHGKAGRTLLGHNLHFNGNTLRSVTTARGSVCFSTTRRPSLGPSPLRRS